MTFIDIITFLVIVIVCISIAQAIFDFRRGGLVISALLGISGAVIGIVIARSLDLPDLFTVQVGERDIPILWSIMGSGFFAIFLSFVIKRV